MGCDDGPTLNRNRVDVYEVHRRDAYTDLSVSLTVLSGVKETNGDSLASIDSMLASTSDGGGRNTHIYFIF